MCNFTITFTGNATDIVAKTRDSITKAGGKFEGDATSGTVFMSTPIGAVEGNYTITGQDLSIEITKKPAFVSCGLIESELKKRVL